MTLRLAPGGALAATVVMFVEGAESVPRAA
jgi:hypothetical protein